MHDFTTFVEGGHTHEERRVHAILFITFSHTQRNHVVFIWCTTEGFVCCGKFSISASQPQREREREREREGPRSLN